ncbi:MAG: DUF6261 family protein [Prevotellaceae bacterium]|jgi:hypothetical protein|nr:DUF6261 family protein [Prevotellaceae bacterium]
MKILKIRFSYLRNEAHYQYLVTVRVLINGDTVIATLLADDLPVFYQLIDTEKTLIDAVRGSAYTEEIADTDLRRDRCIVGINSAINVALHHFNSAVQQAGHRLEVRMKAFNGEIERKSYEEESAAVGILIADLQDAYAADVATIGITEWVTEMANVQTRFEQLYLARNEEWSQRPHGHVPDIRREVETKYRIITDKIDAYNILNNGAADAFVEKFNQNVTYYNDHAHRPAKKDLGQSDHTVIEPIETQPYSGKPITVVPKAYYREDNSPTVELTLGKDFSVTYKNNVEVGTAEVTLHGKGAYKGQKTATFNIAR